MPTIKKISLIYLPILLALVCLFSGGAHAQQAPPKKNVMVLHWLWRISSWEIPFNSSLHNAFLADIAVTAGITHVYLGLDDFPDSVYPQKLIEELRDRIEKNPVDLVISLLPGAVSFLLSYGPELFPGVPKVFALPSSRNIQKIKKLKNAVIIPGAAGKDQQKTVERIFSLLPDTQHLVVVCGDSSVDRHYLKNTKRAIASSKRVTKVSYLVGLPLEELWKRVSGLAPDTAILFTTYEKDKNGKKQGTTDVGVRLAIRANAPVFSWVESLIGNGIVGGSVTSAGQYGKDTAEVALRLLKGEQPSVISPNEQILLDVYDWRALKRWNISEGRLPPGSIVRFKTPSIWDLYRWYIISAILLVMTQSGLISILLRQRAQRRRAQTELAERLRFEEMLSGLSARFVNVSVAQVDQDIQRGLKSIAKSLNLDRISVFEVSQKDQKLLHVHSHMSPDVTAAPTQIDFSRLSWASQKIFNGEIIMFSDPADLPAEAGAEKNFLRAQGIISMAAIPLSTGEKTLGLLSLTMLRHRRKWPNELIRQCRLVAEVFSNALARRQQEESLIQAEAKYRTVADFTYDWEYWVNVDDTMEYISPSCERISGYPTRDFEDNPSLFKEIIVPEDRDIWDRHYHDSRQELKSREIQFRIQRRDGQIRWIEHACQPVYDDQGNASGFRASNRDITKRKQTEVALRQSKNFNRSILDTLQYHIAVLDRQGNILDVNESWLWFARENDAASLDRIGSGVNYLEVCRQSADDGDKLAQSALEGIQSVLGGTRERFVLEYPCDSPAEKRWFLMRVIPFSGRKGGGILSHIDITERKLAEIDLRNAYTDIEQLKNQLETETAYLREEIKLEHNFESIIGKSAAIQYVLYKVEQVAETDTNVLVLGETGTGKELISRAIHNNSLRKARSLVKVNGATLPSNLIESELFGHERGAFTGAQTLQMGRFEVADGTSIFLDEIGELPLELQSKLLRVIQDGEFERLGSSRTVKVDVRVIAATNRDLEAEVRQGRFREDLFYRLNVFPITAPPLRDRTEDIPLLVEFFVEKGSKRLGKSIEIIPEVVMKKLQDYPWPGNVRELENVIERAVINSSGPKLRLADELAGLAHKEMPTPLKSLQEIEKDHIIRVLEESNWRIDGPKGAALILDMNPSTLRSRLQKLGIKKP